MTTPPPSDDVTFAWCFDHGRIHRFRTTDVPWCTATWVWLASRDEAAALADKQARYGNAQFLHELPADQQAAILDLREIQ